MGYSNTLAEAIQSIIYAQNRLDRIMQQLTRQDVQKIMHDTGYFDTYTSSLFLYKTDGGKYVYGVEYRDGNEVQKGRVYIWVDDVRDGVMFRGDY